MAEPRPSLDVGHVVAGRFQVERHLGSGGMGRVLQALDLETGDRVALKLLRAGLDADAHAVARFRREAAALAALRHPNVAAIRAFGDAGPRLYIAMELVEGPSVDGFLAEHGPVSAAEAAPFVAALCEGLRALHAAGIVHRDLKPSNVLLAGGELGRATLVDLGIARARWLPSLTASGIVIGTPRYMPPEALGGADDLDVRVDVYSAGLLLYTLLSGVEPFGPDVRREELMLAILTGSHRRLAELCRDLPPPVEAVVHRAMAHRKEGRFADASALRDAYREALGAGARWVPGRRSEPTVEATLAAAATRRLSGGAKKRGLSSEETRLLCVVLGRPAGQGPARPADLAPLAEVAHAHGGEIADLDDGHLLWAMAGDGPLTDQAASAARCALRLRRLMPGLRVSLVTGRSSRAGRPGQRIIERARALLDQAEGGVATEETTAALLDGRFTIERGSGAPIVRGEADHIAPALRLPGRSYPCVGRDRELRTLTALYDECVAEPLARPVLVTAEPGVGKTRLVRELLDRLSVRPDRPSVWRASAEPMGGASAFSLLGRALRAAAGLGAAGSPAAAATRLDEFVTAHVPAADADRVTEFVSEILAVRMPEPPSVELTAARRDVRLLADQMQRAFDALLSGACAVRPLVLVLDDIHWGDPSSLAFLDRALRTIGARPCLVLATARPEVHERFPQLWHGRELQEIRLPRLRRRSAEKLVKSALGAIDEERLRRIVDRGDGHPFCLEELIRAERDGRGDTAPETVLAMIEARLAELGAEARRVLRAASILGGSFSPGGLRVLAPDADVAGALETLTAGELVEPQPGSRFPGENELRFGHALVREAAYAMLTDADRRLGHALAAEWLEKAGEPDPLVLAEHLVNAGEDARAADHYLAAASRALGADDLDGAIRLAEEGRRRAGDGRSEAPFRLVEATAHRWGGDIATGESAALLALGGLPRGGAPWWAAVSELANCAGRRNSTEGLGRIGREALEAEVEAGAEPDAITALVNTALALQHSAITDLVEPLLDRAERLGAPFERSDPTVAARLAQVRAGRARRERDFYAYLQACRAVGDAYRRIGHRRTLCAAQGLIGYGLTQLGAYEEAERTLSDALVLANETGLVTTGAEILHMSGVAIAAQGRHEEALGAFGATLELAHAQGFMRLAAIARMHVADVLRRRGELAAARAEILASLDLLAGLAPSMCAVALAVLSRIEREAGDAAAAVDAARQAMADVDHAHESEGLIRLVHAEALAAAGDRAGAAAALEAARAHVRAQAARVLDPELRRSFVERVEEHRLILGVQVSGG